MSLSGGLKVMTTDPAMSRPQWLRANVLNFLALLTRAPRGKRLERRL